MLTYRTDIVIDKGWYVNTSDFNKTFALDN